MMRLQERNLIAAQLAKRMAKTGSLGSRPEAFSEERIPFRASLLDEGGSLEANRNGLKSGRKIRLITADDLQVKCGDGVFAEGEFFIVLAVSRWTAHLELVCGARV